MKGRSLPDGAGKDLRCSAEPDRSGKGSVRQCRARWDRVEPGWVVHDRIGRVGRDPAGSAMAEQ